MFTYQFVSNIQDTNGDLKTTVFYTNGVINVTEDYTDSNPSTVVSTINSRLKQLQSVEGFIVANPTGGEPTSDPLQVSNS